MSGRGRALGAVLVAMVVAVGALAACGSASPPTAATADGPVALNGLVRTPLPTIALDPVADIAGNPFGFRATPGNLQLVYFGYLSCPDVCPTTLADLRVASDELGPLAERVDVAMVTIDPERDTAANLRAYLDHFLPRARGLVLAEPALRTVADAFGAVYGVEVVDGEPQVSHSAFVYVLDDAGRLLVQWPFGTPAEDVRDDVRALLAGRGEAPVREAAPTDENGAGPATAAGASPADVPAVGVSAAVRETT